MGGLKTMLKMSVFLMAMLSSYVVYSTPLAAYHQQENIRGNLTTVGSDTLAHLMTQWADLFKRHHPAVNLQIQTLGSSSAVPALVESTAQFGTMSRRMSKAERASFERRYGYPPTEIKVAIDAIAIFVHQDNPIQFIGFDQIDQIFSANRRCGQPKKLTHWGGFGLKGRWAEQAIQRIGRNSVSGTYGFFKQRALCDGDFLASVSGQPSASSVVQSVSSNLNAIGYAGIGAKTAGVKVLPIRTAQGDFRPVVADIVSGQYPLARYLYLYVNRKPGEVLPALEAEFIRLILSRQGQTLVAIDGFVPLPEAEIQSQLKRLGL